jgi:hypothetical protein
VPDAPPEAGPDRAFDPPPAAPLPGPAGRDVGEGDVAAAGGTVADEDGAQPAESPIAAITAPATIHPLFLFDNNLRTLGRRSRSDPVAEADKPARGAVSGRPILPATCGQDHALESVRVGGVG